STALTQAVNKAPTTTTIASSVNPSSSGQNVTFTATVTSGATGSVQFLDGTVSLGSAVISGGSATFLIASLTAGGHSIIASYACDPNSNAIASPALTQTVNKAPTTTTIASNVNPSSFGQSVTFTATVTSGATGSVQFLDGAASLGSAA